jgi:site-specific recombinase XerD
MVIRVMGGSRGDFGFTPSAQPLAPDHFAVSPHRFRHSLATELMKAPDRNLQLVRSLLGHRSIATTMEYIDIDMDIAGKTLENELSLYLDISEEG